MTRITKLIMLLITIATTLQAQDSKLADLLTSAREAFEGGEYRKTLTAVAQIEEIVGSTTKPATAYLRIISHYRLKEYDKCISAAGAYFADSPAEDETLNEIKSAVSNSKAQIAAVEKERLLQQEAADKWNSIKHTTSISELESFISRYSNTSAARLAQQRIEEIKRLAAEEAERKRQEAIRLRKEEWNRVSASQNITAVEQFIKTYHGTAEAKQATTLLPELKEADAKREGYVEIDGVKWATRNTNKPGTFTEKDYYQSKKYKWDEAFKVCPEGWRLPSMSEFEALQKYAVRAETDKKSWSGTFVKNGKRLVLVFDWTSYWTSTSYDDKWAICFNPDKNGIFKDKKSRKLYVRCIKK